MLDASRQDEPRAIHFLKPLSEHRRVDLLEDVTTNVNTRVRSNSKSAIPAAGQLE